MSDPKQEKQEDQMLPPLGDEQSIDDSASFDDYALYAQSLNDSAVQDQSQAHAQSASEPASLENDSGATGAASTKTPPSEPTANQSNPGSYSAGAGHEQPQFDTLSMMGAEELNALYQNVPSAVKKPAEELLIPFDELDNPEIQKATKQLMAQVVMKQAVEQGVDDAMFHKIAEKLGQNKLSLPLMMSNQALLAEHADDVLETYPEITSKLRDDIKKKKGQQLLEDAGFDLPTIKAIEKKAPEFLEHLAVSNVHETHFPVDGTSLVDRLKAGKDSVLQALARPDVQKAMGWAGLAVGCATGGVVITAGMKGMGYLASRLASNPSFQSFTQKLEGKAVGFLSKVLDIEPQVIQDKIDKGKDVAQKVSGSKWGTLGKAAAMVGVGIALGQIDMVRDAMNTVAVAGLQAGAVSLELANVAQEAIIDGARVGLDVAGNALNEGVDFAKQGYESAVAGISELGDKAQAVADEGRKAAADHLRNVAGVLDTSSAGVNGQYANGPVFDYETKLAADENYAEQSTSEVDNGLSGQTSRYEVKDGDTLSGIAKSLLGEGATEAQILEKWKEIHTLNADIIGPDPDKIYPGQKLIFEAPRIEASISNSNASTAYEELMDKGLAAMDINKIVELAGGSDIPKDESVFLAKLARESDTGYGM